VYLLKVVNPGVFQVSPARGARCISSRLWRPANGWATNGSEWRNPRGPADVRGLDALAILALACRLYGASLVYFRPGSRQLNESFPACASAFGSVGGGCGRGDRSLRVEYRELSSVGRRSRRPGKPGKLTAVMSVFRAPVWVVRWVLCSRGRRGSPREPGEASVNSRGARIGGTGSLCPFCWSRH
jgi:hypothetical protein